MTPAARRIRLAWYGITVFLSSAILLVLEITAGRLIAPYVGVTLYSWTSIIGVVLAGLALGNWIGGRWADRGGDERSTGIALALAAIFSLASLLALTLIAPLLQASRLDLISASFVYVLCLFFVPSLLLGIPTPLLTTLALRLDTRTGHIVGRMHALAALGSIVGAFGTGFVLIQYLGTRGIVLLSAALLALLALPYLRRVAWRGRLALLALAAATAGAVGWRDGYASPCDAESSYFCLRVIDASAQAPRGRADALVLDHLLHGINHAGEPTLLVSPYVHLMQELVLQHFAPGRLDGLAYFFAGGGAYTQPRAIRALTPGAAITVAELDPMVTRVAARRLHVDPAEFTIHHGDARAVLRRAPARAYDVVVTDAFHDIAIPYHLVTREYAKLVRARLRPGGLFVTNVVDAFPDPRMVKAMVKTLRLEFAAVEVWLDRIPDRPERLTYVIAASAAPRSSDVLDSSHGLRRSWFRINEPLFRTGTPLAELPVFSDDFVPVERMIAGLLLHYEGR